MSFRLGDVVDDYCSRCRMLTNNSVEAMLGEEIAKVRCRTCSYSHDYKGGQLPAKAVPRRTSQKAAFDAVLASVVAGKSMSPPQAPEPDADEKPKRPRKQATHHGLMTLAAARSKKKS